MKAIFARLHGGIITIVVALALGVGGVIISAVTSTAANAEEGCTRSGEAKIIGGTQTCDCTITTVSTCSCIVTCPPSND